MAARAALADLISRRALEDLADERSFERGLAYFRNGAVERLVRHKDRITARVVGTDVYTIRLWPDGADLGWDCTCPVGQDGEFCKHLVATGLAWLAGGAKGSCSSRTATIFLCWNNTCRRSARTASPLIASSRSTHIVRLTGDQAYDQAADLLRRIRGLMARAGRSGEFAAYLQALRIEHKAKRNFIQRLETVATEKGQPAASNLRPSSSAD